MDAEFLFHSSAGTFPEEHTDIPEDDPNVAELVLPLSHLRSCQFGEDGVPAGRIVEGEAGMSYIIYTSAHIFPDDDLIVDFTDDEADEIY